MPALQSDIDSLRRQLADCAGDLAPERRREARSAVSQLLRALEHGQVRAAERDADGIWRVNRWVKDGILLAFRLGRLCNVAGAGPFSFADFDTLPVRGIRAEDGVRVVPGGTTIRAGAHLGRRVICMPPSYVNVGAWIGEGTMVDSNVLVGSCAQVGRGVHLSAGVQLGGVLEPAGALPVIIEDEVMVGGNAGVYEGTIVRRGAVLAPGVQLSGSTRVVDVVRNRTWRRDGEQALEIPPGAVVVPGSRPASDPVAAARGISVYAPVIVKYRDGRTDEAVRLEGQLRVES
ncbi:MAG TPA: 2,3,4,5-tetrahydropyridine-2,6-dicarboxylate N-succinyltransferase [Gemmatimonadales bacterium]|jgi:2,3,4,5-tetrahydropyridine-2-carboxylate N-succinyltransferase|nr:2,3,4,5-tetrahydropyridine-2,6-dicarboxylate N-succinyltransferase [Gemmatimonadales bacterium]